MYAPNDNLIEIRPGRNLHIINLKNPSNKTIFFLHGLGGRAEQFAAQIEFFKKDYNIVAPDFLGFGASAKPRENAASAYSFEELSKDVQTIFDRYKTAENFVVGHSYGGAFAAFLTLKNPTKIRKLVLISPIILEPYFAPIKVFHLPVFLLELLRPLYTNKFVKMVFDTHTDPKLIAKEITIASNNPMYVIKPCILGMTKIPKVDISNNQQPTLVILGETDGLTPAPPIYKFYQQLPNVEFIKIKHTSHMVMMELPEKVNQDIKNFVDSDKIHSS